MTGPKLWCALPIVVLLVFSCAMGPRPQDGVIIQTNIEKTGKNLVIDFQRGASFSQVKKFGLFKFTITPQMAVWAEDTLGNYVQTIYVTHKFAKQDWPLMKTNADSTFRATSLPYWMNKYVHSGKKAPTKNNPLPDGVTAATPTGSFTLKTTLNKGIETFVIKAEFNKSFDANEYFGGEGSMPVKINGQPAVVYSSRIDLRDSAGNGHALHLVGRSGESGDDSTLYLDTAKLTTAKNMFSAVTVKTGR